MKMRYFSCLIFLIFFASGCASKDPYLKADNPISVLDGTESITGRDVLPDTEAAGSSITAASGITVTPQTDSASYYATDNPSVCVLTATAAYPKITIPGNTDASQRINDAISQELQTFLAFEKENASYAEENRRIFLENEGQEPEPYTADFSYQLKRCDSQVISAVFSQSDFTGGAHPNYWSYGMTFDTATGERIYLSALSDSTDSFLQALAGDLALQAALAAYEPYIDKNMAVDIEEAFLKNSACWYLDRSGLSFISNPYVLGPYASGTFEFNIPYKNLIGLKERYAYTGTYIQKIFPGISVQHDLNSNGTTDETCYSVAADEDGSNPRPSLTVNGTDFSAEFDKLYMTGPLADAYYLIDVDPDDPYVEIAVTNQNEENPDGTCTHFFRYTVDKKLLYQGKVPGILNETMQVCYNANGNLMLGTPDETAEK